MSSPPDRATVATTAIVAIVTDALRAWLHGSSSNIGSVRREIESCLRDEFAACAREARSEQAAALDD